MVLVFQEMARQVYAREQQLKRQVQQLHNEIDQARNASEVAEITESVFFQQLLGRADELRNRTRADESGGIPRSAAKGLLTVVRFNYLLYTIFIFFDPLAFIQLCESNRPKKEKWMLSSPRLDQCLSVIERRK
ncbi:MAG: hypothetical protein NVSMB27_23770 [Ktedonobacteraceae bacterium]